MAYETAVMMRFNSGQNVLTVKARGQSISHAVDVVEVVRRRFFQGKLTIKESESPAKSSELKETHETSPQ